MRPVPDPDAADDDDLIASAVAGDRGALELVLRALAPQVWAIARRLMGNDADAADASQESLIAITRGIGRFDGRSSIRTWSHRVATNACLDELRRRGRRAAPTFDGELDSGAGRVDLDADLRLDLDAALAALSPDHRAVVVLRDVIGPDYETIAELLDVPLGTVRSRLARARAALLGALSDGPDPRDADADQSGNFSAGGSVEFDDRTGTSRPPRTSS